MLAGAPSWGRQPNLQAAAPVARHLPSPKVLQHDPLPSRFLPTAVCTSAPACRRHCAGLCGHVPGGARPAPGHPGVGAAPPAVGSRRPAAHRQAQQGIAGQRWRCTGRTCPGGSSCPPSRGLESPGLPATLPAAKGRGPWRLRAPQSPPPRCRLGVSKIYVWDNGSDPPLLQLLQKYIMQVRPCNPPRQPALGYFGCFDSPWVATRLEEARSAWQLPSVMAVAGPGGCAWNLEPGP